jgi:hypothetical protein
MNDTPTIAPSDKPLRHRWSEPVAVLAENTPSGCQETERTCIACGMVRITVHPPVAHLPWRAWRTPQGDRTDKIAMTPPCHPSGNVESLIAAPSEVKFT